MEPNDEELSGPAVQKREIFLVVGLIASWLLVVYFLVRTPEKKVHFGRPQKASIRVDKSEVSPALLRKFSTEDTVVERTPTVDFDTLQGVLKKMRDRSQEGPDFSGTLITAEPAPPVIIDRENLPMREEVTRGADQENTSTEETAEQEGEILEPEPAETVEQPPTAAEPTKL